MSDGDKNLDPHNEHGEFKVIHYYLLFFYKKKCFPEIVLDKILHYNGHKHTYTKMKENWVGETYCDNKNLLVIPMFRLFIHQTNTNIFNGFPDQKKKNLT